MLSLILITLAASTFIPCDVDNCESCSVQSPSICVNCLSGYTNQGLVCISQSEFLRESIENCLFYSKDLSCTTCKSGYFALYGRCEPYCTSNCICISPNTCFEYRNLRDNQSKSDFDEDNSFDEESSINEESVDYDSGLYYEKNDSDEEKNVDEQRGEDKKYDENEEEDSDGGKDDDGERDDDDEKDDDDERDNSDEKNDKDDSSHNHDNECKEGCKKCSNPNICEDCEDDYNLTNGTCVASWCHEKCETCSGSICSKCEEEYYLNENTCKKCPDNCKKCSNETYCEECEHGNVTETGKCLSNSNNKDVQTSKSVIIPIVSSFGGLMLIVGITFCVIIKKKRDNAKKNNKTIDANDELTPGFSPIIENLKKDDILDEPSGIMSNNEFNEENFKESSSCKAKKGPAINEENFNDIVRQVELDKDNKYCEQEICVICIQKFEYTSKLRALPCNHAFHQACIFEVVATGSEKTCPICRHHYN